ncbi:DUF3102 domain-containing protein [Cereibacter changlensis]|uniref:DUF3102 domain-containing protein n=1 Tax=Cereibacter changlensis TaxID=402884 RepID=UPI0040345860
MKSDHTDRTRTTAKNVAKPLELTVANRKLCDETRDCIRAHEKKAVAQIVEIGKLLIRVKDALDHGAFTKWVEAEIGWNLRTAQNYMSTARNLADKCETVSHLPLATVYQLAAAPDQVREELVASITDPAKPPVAEIKRRISDAKFEAREVERRKQEAEAKAAKDAKKTPEAREAERKRKAVAEEEDKERQRRAQAEEERLTKQAAVWLVRLGDLAPEMLRAFKRLGPARVLAALEKVNETPAAAPRKPETLTLAPSDYSEVASAPPADEQLDELDLSAAFGDREAA